MTDVVLRHPKLPGRTITVQESAVPIYERSGWVPKARQPERPGDQPAKSSTHNRKEN